MPHDPPYQAEVSLLLLDDRPFRRYLSPMPASKHLDIASLATIVVTLILFAAAMFVHGLTQHLLLETAVFLVSVKLILMSYKNSVAVANLQDRLDRIEKLLSTREPKLPEPVGHP